MKITNFKELPPITNGNMVQIFRAAVNVEEGVLWFKKTKTREVFKFFYSTSWRFVDNGEYTPWNVVESLEELARQKNYLTSSFTHAKALIAEADK